MSNKIVELINKRPENKELALLFVPGTGSKKEIFRGIANEIRIGNSFLMDLPMHGTNTTPGESFEDYVNSVKQVVMELRKEGYKKILVVGHSLGGAIALSVARLGKQFVDGAYVLCGSYKFDSFGEEFREGLKRGEILLDRVRPGVGLAASPVNEYNEVVLESEAVFIQDFNIDLKVNFEDKLSEIEVPIGYMVGEEDELILPEMIETMQREITHFEKTMFGPLGHMFPFAEKKEVATIIESFIVKNLK